MLGTFCVVVLLVFFGFRLAFPFPLGIFFYQNPLNGFLL
jgi:hypothetical protein